ncbi:OTU domain-containing protein 4 isoform X2 [Pungitius pungitius]|uniref:OTU domain-containing protein 4 isoform X2 n=1 Tax=Pungitius pungitius TaxID=134920 RepID=UPI002E14C831
MDGGGTKSSEEREAEKSMDGYLKTQGLHRKKIAKDGSCLFRAVAEQVLHNQGRHTEVRAKCVEFLKENRGSYEAFIEGDFEDYLFKLRDPQWVGEVEINALAVIYKRDFFIFQEPGKPAVNITDNNFKDKVQLCFLNGNHYDSVYAVSRIQAAALCQSILYELLYGGVFRVERGALGSCQRSGRPADLLSDDAMNVCASSDDSEPEADEPLWVENGANTAARPNNQRGRGRGRVLLPERVRRSLNPTLLRNVEYDVWHKSKRAQQKMDYCIAAGMQFAVGDRCQVRLEGRSHSAVIKEVSPNNGPVSVYLEELGSRKQVPLWSLRPPSEENSWSTVVNRGDKKLSNGHGDWEERSRGRGRGKNIASASSSFVSPATTPGASGRVQKQHSWPPQATVEEQGGARDTRKSLSSVDPHFGLTERQRSAKEVEEKNMALVEIQLRDENSFPALGGDGGRRKGGDKRWCSTTTPKSPADDVRAPSPAAAPLPPFPAAAPLPPLPAAAAPPANCERPRPPSAAPSIKPPPAGGAAPPSLPPAAPPSAPPSLPPSATLFLSPALPAASPLAPPSSSTPPPTFIAPIAPSPTAALGFLPRPSPPLSSFPRSPSPASFSSPLTQPAPVSEAPPPSK